MSNQETSKLYVEETTVRLVAAQVVLITAISLITGGQYIALALSLDFAVRAFTSLPSPLAAVAKLGVKKFHLRQVKIFAAPKKFAAAIGFLFALAVSVLLFFNFYKAAYLTGSILLFFAFLESVFKICVGCYVYDWIIKPFAN